MSRAFDVPLEGFTMRLRTSELQAVATGLGTFDVSAEGDAETLAAALRRVPISDRPPTWELAVRHFGRGKPIAQAAGEIGLDALHGEALLARFAQQLTRVPPPESTGD